jgi:alpha-1,6-mannosyltransferase
MRIVDVCAFYTPHGGGVRTYVEAKLRSAEAFGHEMIVLAPGERSEIVKRGPAAFIMTIPSPALPVDRRYRYFHDEMALHRALDALRPDHVEVSSPWSSATMVGRWQGSATRSLVMHSDPVAAYAYRWLGGLVSLDRIDRIFAWFWRHLRRVGQMVDLVVCANRQLTERLRVQGIAKAQTVPMGIEPDIFSPALRSEELRRSALRSLGLAEDATLLLGVGRLAAEKRWEMVIRAAEEAGRRQPLGLLLVGDGPRRRSLEVLAERCPTVLILPPIVDRGELGILLASADALIHGCEAETFCMVAAEARASGVPLIVPDRGAACDQLVPGGGLTYRAGRRRSLESSIHAFVARDPKLQREITAPHRNVRTIGQHFEDLFARYAGLITGPAFESVPVRPLSPLSRPALESVPVLAPTR